MVVCNNKKCIFIHIPKTAGTSIEQFLKDKGQNEIMFHGVQNNRSLHHLTALEFKRIIPSVFNNYYKFSMVRNPYDRLLSEYYWTPVPNLGFKYGKTKADFLYKVINIVKNKRFFDNIYYDHFIPQYMFLYEGKKIIIDEVFKYESLKDATDYLKNKLNINMDFPYFNKSVKNNNDYWNDMQKEKIYNLYKNDFILFGYEK